MYWTVAVRMGGVFNSTASVAILFVITYAGVANWATGKVTVCAAIGELLPLKLLSPAYVAVSVLLPVLVKVSEHWPAATVAVQETVPSLTVTFPVGVPLPPLGVTLYCTVTD